MNCSALIPPSPLLWTLFSPTPTYLSKTNYSCKLLIPIIHQIKTPSSSMYAANKKSMYPFWHDVLFSGFCTKKFTLVLLLFLSNCKHYPYTGHITYVFYGRNISFTVHLRCKEKQDPPQIFWNKAYTSITSFAYTGYWSLYIQPPNLLHCYLFILKILLGHEGYKQNGHYYSPSLHLLTFCQTYASA